MTVWKSIKDTILWIVMIFALMGIVVIVIFKLIPRAESMETEPAPKTALQVREDWNLTLVNRENLLLEGFTPVLTDIGDGHRVDSRIAGSLQEMLNDAKAAGLQPKVLSSYRSYEEQKQEMEEKIEEFVSAGKRQDDAVRAAREYVAAPGASEHQLGLAVDLSSDGAQAQKALWNWLKENSWKYGFIQRYPENKTSITGIRKEDWHYRYVGKEAAKKIVETGQCLEEYVREIRQKFTAMA